MLARRHVLALAAAGALAARASRARAESPSGKSVLFLGGTGFLGPHMVRYCKERGHTVTLFNRGKTNPGLFPDVESLVGDRDGKLDALKGRRFDAVIDTSGYVPRHVRDSAKLLKDSGCYLFVSTVSVYADTSRPGMTEDAAVFPAPDKKVEDVDGATYGPLKAACEAEARAVFGERAIVVRPGLIVGPGDNTDRFTYWPARIWRGGEVLAPGNPTDPVQLIDVRDLGEFCVRLAESARGGTFNALGPAAPLSIAELLHGIRATTAVPVSFTWVPADFLEAEKVAPWSDLPVWVPPVGEYAGFGSISAKKAIDAGLTFRPLADTARDTAIWYGDRADEKLQAGLPAEREAEVLAKWHAKG